MVVNIQTVNASSGVIEVSDLDVFYGRVQALAEVSCVFCDGITGVLGPNGAGKSTLFKVLTNTLAFQDGCIKRDGVELVSAKTWKKHVETVGYLPQDPGWVESFTVVELCLYMAGLRSVPRKQRQVAAEQAIESVGLQERAKTQLRALSGGMRRRAFLAQAIVHDPRVLILDEPTSGLDPVQRLRIRELLACLGRTIILSTHLVEDVAHIAGAIVVLDKGHVVWQGSPDSLATKGDVGGSDRDTASVWERGFMSVLYPESEE